MDVYSGFEFESQMLDPMALSAGMLDGTSLLMPQFTSKDAGKTVRHLPPTTSAAIPDAPMFSAPTHQYDEHRQEASPVPGAFSKTLQVNQWPNLSAYRTLSPTFDNLPATPPFMSPHINNNFDFDFATNPFGASAFDGPSTSPASPLKRKRIYPGFHQQQHEQQQLQQQQLQQQQLQQQQQQQQQQQHQQQLTLHLQPTQLLLQPLPENTQAHFSQGYSVSSASPMSDERASVEPPRTNGSRSKKNEDEMDEDEKLLNSEEGKKLPSKERRQLRNKVSARHFRSRRKEQMMNSEERARKDAERIETQKLLLAQRDALIAAMKEESQQMRQFVNFIMSVPGLPSMLQQHAMTVQQQTGTVQQFPFFPPTQPLQPDMFAMFSASPPNLPVATTPLSFTNTVDPDPLDSLVNLEVYEDDVEDENTEGQRKKRIKSI